MVVKLIGTGNAGPCLPRIDNVRVKTAETKARVGLSSGASCTAGAKGLLLMLDGLKGVWCT